MEILIIILLLYILISYAIVLPLISVYCWGTSIMKKRMLVEARKLARIRKNRAFRLILAKLVILGPILITIKTYGK